MSQTPPTLDYNSQPTRSRLATASLILSIIALPTSFIFIGIFPAVAALILDCIAPEKTTSQPYIYSNLDQLNLAVILAFISITISCIALGWAISLPST